MGPSRNSEPVVSIWREPPTVSPSFVWFLQTCAQSVYFFVSFLSIALDVQVNVLVSIFPTIAIEG